APFSSPYVDERASVLETLKLGDPLLGAVLETSILKHAEHAVVEDDRSLGAACDELANFFREECRRFGPDVELLVARFEHVLGSSVLDHGVDRNDEFNSLLSPFSHHLLGLLNPRIGNEVGLVAMVGIFSRPNAYRLAVKLADRLSQGHGE